MEKMGKKRGELYAKAYIFHISNPAYKPHLYAGLNIGGLFTLAHNHSMNALARDSRQIGNLIRRARKNRKWSQQELGAKTGLRQATISVIENGNPAVKIETLLAVLAMLDLEFQIAPRTKSARSLKAAR